MDMRRNGWVLGASRISVAAALVALPLLVAGVAFAANWVTTDSAYKAGGPNVVFHQCELSNNSHDAFHSNDSHDINPTAINSSLFHGCDTEDVRINDFAFGTDRPAGFYECHAFNSPQNCDRGHAHINTSYSQIPEDYQFTLLIICEEIGHSVGLAHAGDPDSCMSVGPARHLTNHDQGLLNQHY